MKPSECPLTLPGRRQIYFLAVFPFLLAASSASARPAAATQAPSLERRDELRSLAGLGPLRVTLQVKGLGGGQRVALNALLRERFRAEGIMTVPETDAGEAGRLGVPEVYVQAFVHRIPGADLFHLSCVVAFRQKAVLSRAPDLQTEVVTWERYCGEIRPGNPGRGAETAEADAGLIFRSGLESLIAEFIRDFRSVNRP